MPGPESLTEKTTREPWRDERTVTVVSDQVLVTVPDHQFVDFAVCPDGEIHALFNMPGLPAGTYRLRLRVETAAPEDPDQASILLTVLPGGNAGSSSAHPVPAGSPVAFVLLVVALSAGAAVAIGYRSTRS